MLYERINEEFQPSATTIMSCLSVRKQEFNVSGIIHPGLHELHGLAWDVTAVMVVVVAELTGMSMLFSQFQTTNYPASQLLVGAALLIFVDFVLAYFHHRYKAGTATKLRAQILLLGTDSSIESYADCANKEITIKWRLGIAFLFAVLIVTFAALKFTIYFGLAQTIHGSNLPGQNIVFAFVLYSVTAVLHIKNTGYFIAWVYCSILYLQDVRRFQRSRGAQCRAETLMKSLPDHAEFKSLKPVRFHCVELNPHPRNPAEPYVLKAKGLLLDSEVKSFADHMVDPEAKRIFALKALALQLRYL